MLSRLAVASVFASSATLKKDRARSDAKAPRQPDAKPKMKNRKTTYKKDDPSTWHLRQRDTGWLRFGGRWRPMRPASPRAQRIAERAAALKREWRQQRNLGHAQVPLAVYIAQGMKGA